MTLQQPQQYSRQCMGLQYHKGTGQCIIQWIKHHEVVVVPLHGAMLHQGSCCKFSNEVLLKLCYLLKGICVNLLVLYA
jgi:hypothetical protein